MLPVIFIIAFILFLFLIYAYKNLGLKAKFLEIFCCISQPTQPPHLPPLPKRTDRYLPAKSINNYVPASQLAMNMNKSNRNHYAMQHSDFSSSEFGKFRETLNPNFYVPNDQFYLRPGHVTTLPMKQNVYFGNSDYHKLYSTNNHASKMIVSFRQPMTNNNTKFNHFYNSEETIEYNLPNADDDEQALVDNLKRNYPFHPHQQQLQQHQHQRVVQVDTLTKSEIVDRTTNKGHLKSSAKSFKRLSKQFSSVAFNLSEINQNDLNRASTFRALNTLTSQDVNVNESDSAATGTLSQAKERKLSKLSNKLKDLSGESSILKSIYKELKFGGHLDRGDLSSFSKKSKYSRLCKSFTFLSSSQRGTGGENQLSSKSSYKYSNLTSSKQDNYHNHRTYNEGACENDKRQLFASEPTKLGSAVWSSISFKPLSTRANYLKHLNMVKSASFQNKSLSSASNLTRNRKINSNLKTSGGSATAATSGANRLLHDAAVQTSILFSENSSSNSQITNSLMQTNTFGSILGNFGSASLKPSQTQAARSRRRSRPRAYSDGNVLSDTSATSNFGAYSVSFSKLVHLRAQVEDKANN
jgi:hypothetical protein